MAELFTSYGQKVFSYRFDTPLWNASITDGARHYDNVMFSFQNISGAMGPVPQYQNYRDLSRGIGEAYVRFVNALDPNGGNTTTTITTPTPTPTIGQGNSTNAPVLPYWPAYDLSSPKNMVLNANKSWVENDTYRKEGMAFINTPYVARELLG